MKVEAIEISLIDQEDNKYLIGPLKFDSSLERSIKEIGLINPIKLISKASGYQVLTGWKRLKIFEKLEIEKVNARIYDQEELTSDQIYKIIYFDNKERITELEKAEIILRFVEDISLEEEKVIKDILPLLGIKPSHKNLVKYSAVSKLENIIKHAFFEDKLSFEQLIMLSEIESPEIKQKICVKILSRYRFNNNETRELIKEIIEILNRDKIGFDDFIKNVFKKIGDKATKGEFRKELKNLRYPNLSKVYGTYKSRLKDLNLSDKTTIKHHPYFESNNLELEIKINSSDELKESIKQLLDEVDMGKIDSLIKAVKEGK